MTENTSLFKYEELKKARTFGYKKSKSRDGSLTVMIEPEVARKIKRYCALLDINCTHFVNEAMAEKVEEVMKNKYDMMTEAQKTEELYRLEAELERLRQKVNDND